MRTRWPTFVLLAVFAASGQAFAQRGETSEPAADRCEATDCFNQLRIRHAEVVDETTLIVYVGQQECPFLVDLTGIFCDLTYLPTFDIIFRPSRAAQQRSTPIIGGSRNTNPRGAVEQTRVCANDIHLGIEADPFTTAPGAVDEISGLSCRLQNVRSLTDDERLQIYVDREIVAPPPPFGTGRVSVPEETERSSTENEEAAGGDESVAVEPEERADRRRRRRERSED